MRIRGSYRWKIPKGSHDPIIDWELITPTSPIRQDEHWINAIPLELSTCTKDSYTETMEEEEGKKKRELG